MYWHMAIFGPWMPNWCMERLKMRGVALIMALDHHEHHLHIINHLSQLDHGITSSSGVYNLGLHVSTSGLLVA